VLSRCFSRRVSGQVSRILDGTGAGFSDLRIRDFRQENPDKPGLRSRIYFSFRQKRSYGIMVNDIWWNWD